MTARLHSPSAPRLVASLLVASCGLMVFAFQPLLYGAYVREGVLPDSWLGVLGAVEALAIAFGSGFGIPLLKRMAAATVALCALALLIGANSVFPASLGLGALIAVRAVAGVGGGLLTSICSASIARASRVGSWAAGLQLTQALVQLAIMQFVLPLLPAVDGRNLQIMLAALAGLCVLLTPFLPHLKGEPLVEEKVAQSGRLDPNGVFGLFAMFLFIGGAFGIWAYAELWLANRGLNTVRSTELLTICVGGQLLGAIMAVVGGLRGIVWPRLVGSLAVFFVVALLWYQSPTSAVIAFLFGVCWQFTQPAFSSVLVELDPTRRVVPFGAAAQLSGIATIPALAGLALGGHNLDHLYLVFAGMLVVSGLVILSRLPRLIQSFRQRRDLTRFGDAQASA